MAKEILTFKQIKDLGGYIIPDDDYIASFQENECLTFEEVNLTIHGLTQVTIPISDKQLVAEDDYAVKSNTVEISVIVNPFVKSISVYNMTTSKSDNFQESGTFTAEIGDKITYGSQLIDNSLYEFVGTSTGTFTVENESHVISPVARLKGSSGYDLTIIVNADDVIEEFDGILHVKAAQSQIQLAEQQYTYNEQRIITSSGQYKFTNIPANSFVQWTWQTSLEEDSYDFVKSGFGTSSSDMTMNSPKTAQIDIVTIGTASLTVFVNPHVKKVDVTIDDRVETFTSTGSWPEHLHFGKNITWDAEVDNSKYKMVEESGSLVFSQTNQSISPVATLADTVSDYGLDISCRINKSSQHYNKTVYAYLVEGTNTTDLYTNVASGVLLRLSDSSDFGTIKINNENNYYSGGKYPYVLISELSPEFYKTATNKQIIASSAMYWDNSTKTGSPLVNPIIIPD